ncbi:LytR/AlgR family response regulator transcription factor [Hymenobacter yonginensis]|uniref:LytTR family DNA-binding domain-containing protein n=1 Tax=Hymenobacter yonginensis TaxID=748197 RepID=A0ABY7PM49_9BACT|nr:LytTR family DNA-binding domain-containing protein [Hymenobacter yonginensis]WBO84287.1 LytTR family DNA-binding domain-containing protein [Hymenobacter yonginensis]
MFPASSLTCALLDGNDLQRTAFTQLLQQLDNLTLVASCATAEEALAFYRQGGQADILFVAADTAGLNVLDTLTLLRSQSELIVLASQEQHATQALALPAVFSLQYPVSLALLRQVLQRVREQQLAAVLAAVPEQIPRYTAALFVKSGSRLLRVDMADIVYIEAVDDYASVVTERQKLLVSSNLKLLAAQLPMGQFQRIHRSYIVNVDHLVSIEENTVGLTKGIRLPIGKSYRDSFYRYLIRV